MALLCCVDSAAASGLDNKNQLWRMLYQLCLYLLMGITTIPSDIGNIRYWIYVLCRMSKALGKGQIALGKVFAECGTRQRTHGKKLIGKVLFAECLLSGIRQRKATVMALAPLTVVLPSANLVGTRQRFFIFF